MAENDTQSGGVGKEAVEELKKELEAIANENKELKETVVKGQTEQAEKLGMLTGQLTVLHEAAKADFAASQTKREEPVDIVAEPEKALEHFWQKRAAPIVQQQAELGAQTQRQLVSIQHGEDWKEFSKDVDALIQKGGLTAQTLAVPGTYERLLALAKADKIDSIVEKKVAMKLEAEKAKNATSGAGVSGQASPKPGESTEGKPYEASQDELRVMAKLGVAKERWAKEAEGAIYQGAIVKGTTVH